MGVSNPFVLRSVTPPLSEFSRATVTAVERLGKRLVFAFERERYLVIHLMIAGRLRWVAPGKKPPGRISLVHFEFDNGSVVLTEAGSKRRASLTAVDGRGHLLEIDRGGLDVFASTDAQLIARLRSENHTLKRSLTDPRMLDGIGNSYSDEILHAARMSPLALTSKLTDDDYARLISATRRTLTTWTERLRDEVGEGWPRTKRTIARGARPMGDCWLIGPCRDCSRATGRDRWMSCKLWTPRGAARCCE